MIEIKCSNKCFKCISSHITIVRRRVPIRENQLIDSHLFSQSVECITLYYLGACIGKKTFTLIWEMLVNNVANNSIKYCIAEKLESFVVYRLSLCITTCYTLVQKSSLVIIDIVGNKANDMVQRQIKLLLLAERELYSINYIIQHIS